MADRMTFDHDLTLSEDFPVPSLETWTEVAQESLGGLPLEKLTQALPEGVAVKPLFTNADALPPPAPPGQAPFTRGSSPLGTNVRGWDVGVQISHPDPAAAASQITEALSRGASAVILRTDVTTRTGAAAPAESTGDGVMIDTVEDLDRVFEPVPVGRTPVYLDGGGNGLATAALFIAAARRRKVDLRAIRGGFRFDPLGALASDGELTTGLDRSLDLAYELAAWGEQSAPGMRTLAVSTIPYHTSGATAVQELAYALATGVEIMRHLEDRGMTPEAGSRQLEFVFAIGRDTFVEIAKLRAFRRLWSRILDACGAKNANTAPVHAVTSPRTLTVHDPWVNLLRITNQTFAAVCGGAETISTQTFDAAIGHPSELARRLALNTHTILREECHLHHVADPAGGSWYVEHLTEELAQGAWSALQTIEADGGMRRALADNSVGSQLAASLAAARRNLSTRRIPVTGVSTWPNLTEKPVVPAHMDLPSILESRRQRLAAWRDEHDPTEALQNLSRALESGERDIVELAVAAAGQGATADDLATALRAGARANRAVPIPEETEASGFERLRDAAEEWSRREGRRPRLFLATLGPIPEHKPRATFAKNFFEAGGIETVDRGPLETPDDVVAAFTAAGTDRVCLCSTDARYEDQAADVARALRTAGAATVWLAGRLGNHEAAWREAGINGSVYLGCNVLESLSGLLAEMGVLS